MIAEQTSFGIRICSILKQISEIVRISVVFIVACSCTDCRCVALSVACVQLSSQCDLDQEGLCVQPTVRGFTLWLKSSCSTVECKFTLSMGCLHVALMWSSRIPHMRCSLIALVIAAVSMVWRWLIADWAHKACNYLLVLYSAITMEWSSWSSQPRAHSFCESWAIAVLGAWPSSPVSVYCLFVCKCFK